MEKFLHMHLLISIIFSMVLVVLGNEKSFSPLNSSYIMEAKKRFMSFDITKLANPPMPSYTFSIYNRDLFEKSKFKDYDSLLKNRLARSQARAKYLGSILENGNAIGNGTHESKRDKVPKTTSIRFVGSDYVAAFHLGTDQTLTKYLLVDTGSDFVWWQCGPCEPNKCYAQKYELLYDLTRSRTYRRPDCRAESSVCFEKPNIFKCGSTNICVYDYAYTGGTRTRGWIAEDVITFALDHSQVKILFGCGKDQMSGGTAFNGDYSGIAGLGRRMVGGGYSLSSQFGADIMALCLPEFYSTKSTTLTFHTTPFKKTISAKLVPNPSYPSVYSVNLYKLFVNNKEIPLPRNELSGGCVVDTGTAVSYFPANLYTAFRDSFRNAIPFSHAPSAPFDTCYMVDPSVVQHFPIVKMYFDQKNSKNLLLLEPRRVMVHQGAQFCLAFLPWNHPVALVGGFQLQGIGLTFDTAANILSFGLDAC